MPDARLPPRPGNAQLSGATIGLVLLVMPPCCQALAGSLNSVRNFRRGMWVALWLQLLWIFSVVVQVMAADGRLDCLPSIALSLAAASISPPFAVADMGQRRAALRVHQPLLLVRPQRRNRPPQPFRR